MSRARLLAVCAALLLLAAAGAQAQQGETPAAGSSPQPAAEQPAAESSQEPAAGEHEPEEYSPEEFPQFLHDLRRGEIIMVGSFPFSLFLTLEVYDVVRYLTHDQSAEYAPWPFRQPGAAPYTSQENLGVLGAAVGVSLLVAVADYIIGRLTARGSR